VPTFVAEVWRVLKGGGTFALVDNISPDVESTPGFSSAELRDAALVYNAFEKIRDPSHGRCLGMAEWSEVLGDTGLEVSTRSACPRRWSSSLGPSAWAAMRLRSERLRAMLTRARRRCKPS
jgi:hypothetical protein